MTPVIGHYGGYRKTLSFGLTCIVYHATTTFCRRNYNYQNDALGKTVGQMVGAARSARQNIVEGSSRAGTSKETELKLLDVAKASLQELAGDYEAFIVDAGETPWSERDPKYLKAKSLSFDDFSAKDDLRHEYDFRVLWFMPPMNNFEIAKSCQNMPNDLDVRKQNTCNYKDFQQSRVSIDHIVTCNLHILAYDDRLRTFLNSLAQQQTK